MKKNIPFVKMHGLGNDFVILNRKDLNRKDFPDDRNMHIRDLAVSDLAAKMSDRRMGIGCDQFILYEKLPEHIEAYIYNGDGSEAQACGNASRCLSRLIYDKYGQKETTLKIGNRKVYCRYISPEESEVDMGEVSFKAGWMPTETELWKFAELHMIEPKEILCVDVGNPHLVIFSSLSDPDKAVLGENLQKINLFRDGVNVNFAAVREGKIYLKVWERGTGFTAACGSGACASFAAAVKLNFISSDTEVVFPLGALKMSRRNKNVVMSGPAEYVFTGEYLNG